MSLKRVCVVQARTGSTRLPGKVIRDVAGRPMLAQQLGRLARCASIDELVVATTTLPEDDPVAHVAQTAGARVVRGSSEDVLGRYVAAASASRADVVVRVTGDCPLIDPAVTDAIVDELIEHADSCDYASNVLRRTYPRGLDAEAFFVDTLLRVDRLARTKREREHVTITIRSELASIFLVRSVEDATDNSDLRWTVDEEQDLVLVRRLYDELDLATHDVAYPAVLAYVRERPELTRLNAQIHTWTPNEPRVV